MVGKFLDEESLVKSYENLEREFTKKCQELARLKKELDDKQVGVEDGGAESVATVKDDLVGDLVCEVEGDANSGGLGDFEVLEDGAEVVDESPEEEAEFIVPQKLKEAASEFISSFPDAREFSREIAKELILNKALLETDKPFYLAYLIVKDRLGEKVAQSLEAEKVGASMEAANSYPKLLKGSKGDGFSAPLKKKYATFEDARGDLIKKYFS